MKTKICIYLSIALLGLVSAIHAVETSPVATSDNTIKPRLSTDEVKNQITLDREANPLYESKLLAPLRDWQEGVAKKTGFNWSIDYSALFMEVSESFGEDKASGGMVRFFGFWDLLNRDEKNNGSLNWKVENRHKYSDIPPGSLGFQSGYIGIYEPPFSDEGSRLTNLYWKQYFADGKWAAVGGFLDITDFFDVYLMASPWTGFNNFVFSTGSAATDLPNDATLGAAAGGTRRFALGMAPDASVTDTSN
jgi:porin